MIPNHFGRSLRILLACTITLGLTVASTCPTGIEFCIVDYDFWGYDYWAWNVVLNIWGPIVSTVSNGQECVEICSATPGSVGGAYGYHADNIPYAGLVCYCKFALNGPGNYLNNFTAFSLGNNTAIRAHCDDITPSCQNLSKIKSYIVSETNMDIHCGDLINGDQTQFGDFDGDGTCDVVCWNRNSGTIKWAKGEGTLKFVKPSKTPDDGSIGSFCGSTSTLRVKDVNWDSKDDLVCTYPDNNQVAMMSDRDGLNPLLLINYQPTSNCPNFPNECLFLDTPSSCAVCPTTGPLQNGIYTKTGKQEFAVVCEDGYKYRGKAAPAGICNYQNSVVTLQDGQCMKQTATSQIDKYSNKRIKLDAIAIRKTDTAIDCAWLCVDDMNCASVHFKHGTEQCELFSSFVTQSVLADDPEYETFVLGGN